MSKNTSWSLVLDAEDILTDLKDRQYLLECLHETLGSIYLHAPPEFRKELTKVSTVLRFYDNEAVVESLKKAIALLEDARR